jgi:hypothetical protein
METAMKELRLHMRKQSKYYPYPSECFDPNMDITSMNKKAFEKRYDAFYEALEQAYPGYYQMGLLERMKAHDEIQNKLGYRI